MQRLLPVAIILAAAACAPVVEGPDGPIALDCGFNPAHLGNDVYYGAALQFESDEACVRVRRRDISEPDFIYKAYPWALEEMQVGSRFGNETLDGLEWFSTHHNWNDAAVGKIGDRTYTLEMNYVYENDGEAFTLTLRVDDAGDESVIELGAIPGR